MRLLSTLPRYFLGLSFSVRLAIVILCTLCSLIPFIVFHEAALGSLLGLGVLSAAWLFGKRGGLLYVLILTPIMALLNTYVTGSIFWSRHMLLGFVIGMLTMFVVAFLVGCIRSASDLAEEARQQLKVAYDRQHQLNRLKDQFLLNVNHELRTPLTEIRGYLELLRDYHEQIDSQTQDVFLNNAVQGCEELQLLIGNVLDAMELSRYKQDMPAEPLVLREIVDEVLTQFDPRKLQEHTIHVEIPVTLRVFAACQPLRQILRNLLSNAFKYSDTETSVSIAARVDDTGARKGSTGTPMVCVSVRDRGLGIPPDELPLLFSSFMRLQRDLSGPIRGSGLGLYICKQLVEHMGGEIWAESTGVPGEGSCFYFTLPRAADLPSDPQVVSSQVLSTPHLAVESPLIGQSAPDAPAR